PTAGVDPAGLADALRAQCPEVSTATAAALATALAERPDERPPTAAAWLLDVGRSTERRWRVPALVLGVLVLGGAAIWAATRPHESRSGGNRSLAVMPFTILGTNAQSPPAQLPTWFQHRLGLLPGLSVVSSARTASFAGEQPLPINDAQTTAGQLDATYFVQ